jgi:hypothetical protein
MSNQRIAAYSFLPWARQGLGIYIREGDQDTSVKVRGSIDVSLQINADLIAGGTTTQTVPRAVQLYGPGDIIGIDGRMIIRTEPRNWITNFESNYMPYIEFYDEDFPWRYTPAKSSSDGLQLRPWLALVVLEESEFKDGKDLTGRPLPYIEVENADQVFPPFDQLWAWAHVHVNGGLGVDLNDPAAVAGALDSTLQLNRDLAYSRVLSPRIIKPNTAYHAFLIPSFESGRLAGLGLDPGGSQFASQGAWEIYNGRGDPKLFPLYHRWYFHTGTLGDFEYLVRLLQPRTVDPIVGRRDMDVLVPGANLPGITGLGGLLRLGGALRPPLDTLSQQDLDEYYLFENWGKPYPHPFQTALAALINLANDYSSQSAEQANTDSGLPDLDGDEDPWIVPPLYGRWHSLTQRLVGADGDPGQNKWVQELNLDPRFRVASGFGTQVVQQNQENYMEAAWQQVGKVLEGNHKIRLGQMAKLTSQVWHSRELAVMQSAAPERFLAMTAPVQRRLLSNGLTVYRQVQVSTLPTVLMSKTARQVLRPSGRVVRLGGFDSINGQPRPPQNLLARVNQGEISAAPPKQIPANLPTEKKLSDQLAPSDLPPSWLEMLKRYPWLRYLPLIAAALISLPLLFIPCLGWLAIIVLLGASFWLIQRLTNILHRAEAAGAIDSDTLTPASVDQMPTSANFKIGRPGQDPASSPGGSDSADAIRFKQSLRNLYKVDAAERTIPVVVRQQIDLAGVAQGMLAGLHPSITIQKRVLGSIFIPTRIGEQLSDPFGEVMVYPEIDLPMYEPLKDISSELFLPNIQRIPNNSITLLESNQKFIESYMVGLNHEFAAELLWREYPTDQRGSYFRQFWDVRGFLAAPGVDPQSLREQLFDIPELHRWDTATALGTHDNRKAQGQKGAELVLVIRGELLKKYPTAVIYAHRAAWELTGDGQPDKTKPRKLADLTPAQESNPPRDLVKTPLYEAKVDPDIYFFGFDMTADQARGGQIVDDKEDPGWFFVIKERPGEPRFGLDLPQPAPQTVINTWNDLAWSDVLNTYTPGGFLRVGEKSITLSDPGAAGEEEQQYVEDSRFHWQANTHAAELAYILFQVPVLMAVHAAEMLKKPGEA